MSEPRMNGVACPQCQGFTTLDRVPCVECVSRMKEAGEELAKAALLLELKTLRNKVEQLEQQQTLRDKIERLERQRETFRTWLSARLDDEDRYVSVEAAPILGEFEHIFDAE